MKEEGEPRNIELDFRAQEDREPAVCTLTRRVDCGCLQSDMLSLERDSFKEESDEMLPENVQGTVAPAVLAEAERQTITLEDEESTLNRSSYVLQDSEIHSACRGPKGCEQHRAFSKLQME